MNSAELLRFVTPDANHGCSHLMHYGGVRCSQTPRVLKALDELHAALSGEPATMVIEIGTLYGAFTQILRDHDISKAAQVHTFDVQSTLSKSLEGDIIEHIGSVFDSNFSTVVDLIQLPGRCLVFCDGGDKEQEVRTFCQHLKVGDVIMCHDYTKEASWIGSAAVGGWPAYESLYCNVQTALESHGCEPFLEAQMLLAAWGCWMRTG